MVNSVFSMTRPAALDVDNFAELYRTHTLAVFNYCLYRVGNRAVAEDLTADTFERAWRARRRYRPERASFATWIFAIARRGVIDWQRRQKRRPLFQLDPQIPDHVPLPESQAEQHERRVQLHQLVLELAPKEQELIALKFGAKMSNREIARLQNKSETAVGSAVYRVMQKIRSRMEGSDVKE